ncbi:HAMP domain-containing histidine kinase [Paenibacillus sp. HN-1]|uniref:sensor histidine kinase n=1 Tax=Paenibacillus TaxID=44249 RepID=UPI001CA9501B|nr:MULTISPECIES: HAMP domain-containing sensor histidine kinase [Paenibacillus]MBY9079342.1 HAMP domain-containing histidine kinase [Paenibacillus sp. CGMCC 1.18879]MBY9087723.1 HAMP domain-containing histidine kinase [Paenibacillus sinensis]
MIKSLYVRIILIFIGAVFLSLIPTFYLVTHFYAENVQSVIMQNMIDGGRKIIQSYAASPPDVEDKLIEGVNALPSYDILIFDQNGILLHNEDPKVIKKLRINNEKLKKVLDGNIYRSLEEHSHPLIAGLPFQIDGKPFALFLAPEVQGVPFAAILRTALLLVLLFGSLFILVAARFLVRPLQLLTKATRSMAKGNFNVRLNIRSKDEIGELAKSFNRMAYDLGNLESMRRQFVSDVSHEIQSPLTSIKGFTQAIRYKKMDDSTRQDMLEIIEEETNRLSRLSSDLLQLSTLEYEYLSLDISTYRLDEQLRHIIMASEPQWSVKNLNIELESKEIIVQADKDKLNQLWTNLVSNAIKFSRTGGNIRITAIRNDEAIRVSIADSGPGIPEEEIEHIFKPFYKVDKSRDRSDAGNGIGLSIVKRIVHLHGGNIEVSSRISEGSIMTVVLPKSPIEK